MFHPDAPEQLAKLNALVHPPVKVRERDLAAEFAREHPDGIAVTEAAILVETGSYKDYDRLIVAVCRPEQQIERVDGAGRSQPRGSPEPAAPADAARRQGEVCGLRHRHVRKQGKHPSASPDGV